MSFREFITNRLYRRSAAKALERLHKTKPPRKLSQAHINRLVENLLVEEEAPFARNELELIGAPAAPILAAALNDPRYFQTTDSWRSLEALDFILELLTAHGPDHVLAAATTLANSPSEGLRKTAALHLASLGRAETIPTLAKLLQDPDGYVRSYVATGVERAISNGRADETFRCQAYDLLLAQCDQNWDGTLNDAPEVVVKLDPQRAAVDLANSRLLNEKNKNTYRIIEACNETNLHLPENLIRDLLERSLARVTKGEGYPHDYVAAQAMRALALKIGREARPMLDKLLKHENAEIQETAANEFARLEGLENPTGFVFELEHKKGFKRLSHPQRVVYCAHMFQSEVCNGGLMQFFGNDSGDQIVATAEALRELDPSAADILVRAMEAVGPAVRKKNQDKRMAAFEGRYDELKKIFKKLEDQFHASALRIKCLLYAIRHRDQFGAK